MNDTNHHISVDHDSVTTNFTEQDSAPVTPQTGNSAYTRAEQTQTFDDLPSAPLPLLYSLESPLTPAIQKDALTATFSETTTANMTAPVNLSPTSVGVVNAVRPQGYGDQPQAMQAYPYAMPQGKEMYMGGAPTAAYRRQSRFDPMANEGEEDEGYGDLGLRHPLRRVQEEEKEDGVSLPSENQRASPVNGQATGAVSTGNASPVSSSPTTQDARSRYSGSTFSSVGDAQFGWWNGNGEYDRSRNDSVSGPSGGPFRSNSFPTAGPHEDDHDAKRRRSDQPASMRDPEEAARLRWQAQNRNASYPASGSMAGNGLRSLIHPPHGSYPRSVSINDGTAYPPPPPQHDDSMRPPPARNGSVSGQLARSFEQLTAAERSARNSISRSPTMAPPPAPGNADRRQSSAFASGPLTRTTPLYEGDRRQAAPGNPYDMSDPARRISVSQSSSPDHRNLMRQSGMNDLYNDTVAAPGQVPAAMMEQSPIIDSASWSRRTSAAETASSVQLNSDSEGSTAKGRGKKRSVDGGAPGQSNDADRVQGQTGMGGMDVLAESAADAAAAEDGVAERDPSPARNGTGPKYTCSFCQKTFSRPSSLRIHTYSHTGERPFVCQEPSCGRRFSVQSNLKRHAKVHALVNQQEAERLRALYAHHPHDQRHPNGLPPIHMQHGQQLPPGQMPGMAPSSGPAPPPHIMDMRDPRMYGHGAPVMQHPAHPGHGGPVPGVPYPQSQGMPPHAQAPPIPYGYHNMPMHMNPGPPGPPGMGGGPGQPASAPPPMSVDTQHGYGNYSFYDQQSPAGMPNYGQPPPQHPHALPSPMGGMPPPMPQGYPMQPGADMADPYQYQKS